MLLLMVGKMIKPALRGSQRSGLRVKCQKCPIVSTIAPTKLTDRPISVSMKQDTSAAACAPPLTMLRRRWDHGPGLGQPYTAGIRLPNGCDLGACLRRRP